MLFEFKGVIKDGLQEVKTGKSHRIREPKATIEAESKTELKEIPPTYRRHPLHSFEEQ